MKYPTHPGLFCISGQKERRIVFWDARHILKISSPSYQSLTIASIYKVGASNNVRWRYRQYKQVIPQTGVPCCTLLLAVTIFFSWHLVRWSHEAYVSKYRLLYMVVSEPIKSFVGYLRKGNTGWELIHIPFCKQRSTMNQRKSFVVLCL